METAMKKSDSEESAKIKDIHNTVTANNDKTKDNFDSVFATLTRHHGIIEVPYSMIPFSSHFTLLVSAHLLISLLSLISHRHNISSPSQSFLMSTPYLILCPFPHLLHAISPSYQPELFLITSPILIPF
jgi:hypothetical protein